MMSLMLKYSSVNCLLIKSSDGDLGMRDGVFGVERAAGVGAENFTDK